MPERIHYANSDHYTPLSPWAHVGYSILFALPVLGLIFLIVFSFDNSNINRRNFARSYWCWLVVAIVLIVYLAGTGAFGLLVEQLRTAMDTVDTGSLSQSVITAFGAVRTLFEEKEKGTVPPAPSSTPWHAAVISQTAASTARPTNAPTTASPAAPTVEPTAAPTEKPAPGGGTDQSFRDVMDSYEAFFNDYVAFMKKYKEADAPLSMLADYLDFMAKYVDMMEALDEIEEDDLSAADWAYYLEVHARIMRKLGELVE